MAKKSEALKPKLAPLWISLIALPGLLGLASFVNRCGSTKVSMSPNGWTVEARDCPAPSIQEVKK